jgi:hypothetical protein
MRQVFYPASFYLHDQCLSYGFETISMRLYTDLPWPRHIQLKLSYVSSVSQRLDAEMICRHVHVSHSGVRQDLRLLDGYALRVGQMQLQGRETVDRVGPA